MSDPRVLFAAERTLLAWNRNCIALMGFGFVIERFGLLIQVLRPEATRHPNIAASFWIGLAFAALATILAVLAAGQHRRLVKGLMTAEVPQGYDTRLAPAANWLVAALGACICLYIVAARTMFG